MPTKIETAAKREERVRALACRIGDICSKIYDKLDEKRRNELLDKLEEFEQALIAYKNHQIPWDSKLVEKVKTFEGFVLHPGESEWTEGVNVKVHEFDTTNSVMDKARDIYAAAAL